MIYKNMTDEERIRRVWDVQEIKNVMGRHAYYHAYNMHEREIDELWVQKPEHRARASFGQNWGYQVGLELIRENYVVKNVRNYQKDLDALCAADPMIENIPENRGIGSMLMHQITTPYIEVARDGQSAQALWYSPGQITMTHPGRVDTLWMYERYGVDFLKEDGEWKIWHLFIGTDLMIPAGEDRSKQPVDPKEELGFGNDGDAETDLALTHDFEAYTARYNYQLYPAIPEPYETFSDNHVVSNGPEGNPKFKKEVLR